MARSLPPWLVLVVAIIAAAFIGWIDQNNDEVQGTVILIVAATATLAFVAPRHGWIAALIVGLAPQGAAVVAHALGIPQRFPMTPAYGGLLALIPAAIGAVIGAVVRQAISPRPAEPSRR
jgi:hypothetical protein